MPLVEIEVEVNADIGLCFDLSRSIDLHTISTAGTKERAIGGRTRGLIELGEIVTWEAFHFGIKQQLTSKITKFDKPIHFRDEQVQGAFAYFIHDHHFQQTGSTTLMKDRFEFKAPFGIVGSIFSSLILKRYMKRFLTNRIYYIKQIAESKEWKVYLSENNQPY